MYACKYTNSLILANLLFLKSHSLKSNAKNQAMIIHLGEFVYKNLVEKQDRFFLCIKYMMHKYRNRNSYSEKTFIELNLKLNYEILLSFRFIFSILLFGSFLSYLLEDFN